MKVIRLEAQNVKKLKAISITPDANTVIVGGENEQGKSSTLDSIMYAIGGKKFYDKAPVRRGSKSAKISCDLGEVGLPEILITRTITESGGGQISITNAEGQQFASPQAMLDKLTGKLTFDPLAFSEMDDKKQLETLKQLVGLDFTAIDQQRGAIYAERTRVNAEAKSLKARVDSIQIVNAPDEEVSVADLTKRLQDVQTANEEASTFASAVLDLRVKRANLEVKLAEMQAELDEVRESLLAFEGMPEPVVLPTEPILQQIQDADATNQKVRAKKQRKEMEKEYSAKLVESEALTAQIDAIDQSKAEQLASAKFPVPGLSFDETGVSFEGTPFSQCSSAQKLRVSVAMGMALNPDLRVLLIRNGSLLDTKNLGLITEMAKEGDFQIWIERVGEGKECHVILEDGEVK